MSKDEGQMRGERENEEAAEEVDERRRDRSTVGNGRKRIW